MPKAISTPLEQQYRLDKFDPDGDTYVTIRQARQFEHEKRELLFAEMSRVWGASNELELKQRISFAEVMRREVEMTMVDCNVLDEDTGQPLFKFKAGQDGRQRLDMTSSAFANAWGKLPPEVASEIHSKVLELNKMWSPSGEA